MTLAKKSIDFLPFPFSLSFSMRLLSHSLSLCFIYALKQTQKTNITNRQFKEQFSIEKCRGELVFLESNLENTESDVVFCHNDLLCANILYQPPTETGHVRGKVAFIDYEYGSYNWRA